MMNAVALSAAKARLSELIDDVRRERGSVVIRKREKAVAVLVDVETFDRLRALEDRLTSLQLRAALKGKKHDLRDVLTALALEV